MRKRLVSALTVQSIKAGSKTDKTQAQTNQLQTSNEIYNLSQNGVQLAAQVQR